MQAQPLAKPSRRYYGRKSEWAAARANEIRDQLVVERASYIPSGQWQKVRAKAERISRLVNEEAKFRAIANRLAASGQ